MLTIRETATALAALRLWQRELLRRGEELTKHDPHFDDVRPLTATEIDGLCEWLNLSEAADDEESR